MEENEFTKRRKDRGLAIGLGVDLSLLEAAEAAAVDEEASTTCQLASATTCTKHLRAC